MTDNRKCEKNNKHNDMKQIICVQYYNIVVYVFC
jgi:hypothetical protein